jgi:Zn-dependent M16 (insulinase) family peptidase
MQNRGKWNVIKQVLNDYLFREIRVKGGAYGAEADLEQDALMTFASWRDPKWKKTLEVFRGVPEYLKNLNLNPSQFESFIIGALGTMDREYPLSVQAQYSDQDWISGISSDDLDKMWQQAKQSTLDDIRAAGAALLKAMQEESLVVFGTEENFKKEDGFIDSIEAAL